MGEGNLVEGHLDILALCIRGSEITWQPFDTTYATPYLGSHQSEIPQQCDFAKNIANNSYVKPPNSNNEIEVY